MQLLDRGQGGRPAYSRLHCNRGQNPKQEGFLHRYQIPDQLENFQLHPTEVYLWERINALTRDQFYCKEEKMKLGGTIIFFAPVGL